MVVMKNIWIKIKIFIKLNFIYPISKTYSKIHSILPKGIRLGANVAIEENVIFENSDFIIGNHVYIAKNTFFASCSEIGNFSSISLDCKIGMRNHPLDFVSTSPATYNSRRNFVKQNYFDDSMNSPCVIGADVLISSGVIVLSGITIGTGAVIGAGAVVVADVPPYAIVAGVPAKVLRYRFNNEIIKKLLDSKWWTLPDEQLVSLAPLFANPDVFLSELEKSNEFFST